jgi:hypothetical protein
VADELLAEHPQPHLVDGHVPFGGEPVDRGRHEQHRMIAARDGQVILAEGACGHAPDHGAHCHAHHGGCHHLAQAGHHGHHRIVLVELDLVARLAGAGQDRTLTQRRGHLGEQRTVGLERVLGPHAGRHRGDLGERRVEAADVAHVHLGDACQVGERDAHARVDVALAGATGRSQRRELPGRIPVQRTLS